MSLFGAERIGCPEVLASLVFIIEDAIEQVERPDDIQNHINLCPNCSRQLEHEQLTHTYLVDALRRAYVEKAPESPMKVSKANLWELALQLKLSPHSR